MNLSSAVECLLFVAGEPLNLQDMARALQCDEYIAEKALRELQLRLGESGSGLQVVKIAGGWQLATRMEYSETIGRLVTRNGGKLSHAALETLAIIAYRQPITIPEIEAVRGVSASGVVKSLQEKRLVAEVGRKQTIGRPILYATTQEFLHYFAISSLEELPALENFEPDEGLTAGGLLDNAALAEASSETRQDAIFPDTP
jgi:segregation and condensation protein B